MTVLIAGCGYLGQEILARLRAAGRDAIGVRRSAAPGCVAADLRDEDALRAALEARTITGVVYCAAADGRSEAAYRAAYVEGLRAVLAVTDAPVIFTSSTAVYAQTEGWVDGTSPAEPEGETAPVLREAERLVEGRGIALRLAGLYGPTRTRLVRKVKAGELTGADRYTNRIHRDDAASASVLLLDRCLAGESMPDACVGVDTDPAPLSEVGAFLAGELGVEAPALEGPPTGKRCRATLLTALGWVPAFAGFREGYPAIVREVVG